MGFEDEYQSLLNHHMQIRNGERLRRLKEGHGQAELMFLKKVWWPLFRDFHYLHPEYEVNDFKDRKRYLDFAYIRPGIRICFEIDGYGPHLKNVSRWQFSDHLDRQNQLMIDGWVIIRFSYDQVMEQPLRCQQVTQQIIGKMLGDELEHLPLSYMEKEVIRLALRKELDITPTDVSKLLDRSTKLARKILADLVRKRILYPSSGNQRIRSYRLSEGVTRPFIQP